MQQGEKDMTNAEVLRVLSEYEACEDLSEWAEEHGGLLADLWRDCQDGELMLWLAARAGVDRRTVVRAACACARTALQYVPAGEERPRRALETADAWTRGKVNRAAVRAAAEAAFAAAAAYDAEAAYATSTAADAAGAAATPDASSAYALAAAAASAASAYAYACGGGKPARAEALVDCANLVRAYISTAEVETAVCC